MDNQLKNYLESVPVKNYGEKRAKIIAECKITPQVFLNWKNGITAVPELAKPVINKIAGKEIYSV